MSFCFFHRFSGGLADRLLKRSCIRDVELGDTELQYIFTVERTLIDDRTFYLHPVQRGNIRRNQMPLATEVGNFTRHNLFPAGLKPRIRHLCKMLLEIVEKQFRTFRQEGKWLIKAHRADRILYCTSQRLHVLSDVLFCVTETHEHIMECLRCDLPALQWRKVHSPLPLLIHP